MLRRRGNVTTVGDSPDRGRGALQLVPRSRMHKTDYFMHTLYRFGVYSQIGFPVLKYLQTVLHSATSRYFYPLFLFDY